jgi:hypothetical protein
MLASRFLFLLAKLEFHWHLASWRVVIRAPAFNVIFINQKIIDE